LTKILVDPTLLSRSQTKWWKILNKNTEKPMNYSIVKKSVYSIVYEIDAYFKNRALNSHRCNATNECHQTYPASALAQQELRLQCGAARHLHEWPCALKRKLQAVRQF
jgi:hypothetical protein